MDKFWKEIALTVAVSMVLPWLLLLISAKELLLRRQPDASPTNPPVSDTADICLPSRISVQTGENTVTEMELEEYVLGVVLAEMPASFHTEALKAQAVVARTYALKRFQAGDREHAAAVCTDPMCCQAFLTREAYLETRGSQADMLKIRAAVVQTEGKVLTYEGQLIESTYFSCSGGKTEDALAVWGTEIPYLQAVPSPGEEQAEKYWASKYFTAEEFADALGRQLVGKPGQWQTAVTYTAGGGVQTIVIGGVLYTGTQLRQLLDLDSTAFVLLPDEKGITVETLGHGHRVGMSQYGADAMAQTGKKWDEILLYYYQGVVIDKGRNLG